MEAGERSNRRFNLLPWVGGSHANQYSQAKCLANVMHGIFARKNNHRRSCAFPTAPPKNSSALVVGEVALGAPHLSFECRVGEVAPAA